jgi:eukaryotic-like serine/threonine-protein kinase
MAHRRRLAYRLRQRERLGDYAPPDVVLDIEDAQVAIRDLKAQIRVAGGAVPDDPNDDSRIATTPLRLRSNPELRNRERMIQKVRDFWVRGVLEKSLYREALIALGMQMRLEAVADPWGMLVQTASHAPRELPQGTGIVEIYDELGGELLILGAPGAGKTTVLLELARELLDRAAREPAHPIPVVFNLSSWAARRLPLAQWLVDELNVRYDVPRKVGQAWVETDQVLPLLDGLDEVKPDQREACVAVINTFRQEHGLVSLVVCSRVGDYEALSGRLRLSGAVLIQPLTAQQLDEYLAEIGEPAAGLHELLQHDPALREFAEAPLVLSTMLLAYQGQPVDTIAAGGTIEQRRARLFDAYVDRMLARRGVVGSYSPEKTGVWLAWLARRMAENSQTVFLVERLQPNWLPNRAARIGYNLLDRLGGALIIGPLIALVAWLLEFASTAVLTYCLAGALMIGLFGGVGVSARAQPTRVKILYSPLLGWVLGLCAVGLSVGLAQGFEIGVIAGFVAGVPIALAAAIVGMPSLSPRHIIVVETLRWSWFGARRFALAAFMIGGIFGVIGAFFGLLLDVIPSTSALFYSAIATLISASGGASAGIVFGGMVGDRLDAQARPNQGIRRSARSALLAWLLFGLVVAPSGGILSLVIRNGLLASDANLPPEMFFWIGGVLPSALLSLVLVGMIGALALGGYAVLSHIALRLVLWRCGAMPLDYVRFLDYAAERVFLRKVGGGYIFVHRLLLEHFASR